MRGVHSPMLDIAALRRATIVIVLLLAAADTALGIMAVRTQWYVSSPLLTFFVALYGTLSGIIVAAYGCVRLFQAVQARLSGSALSQRMGIDEIIAVIAVWFWERLYRPAWLISESIILVVLGVYLTMVVIGKNALSISSPVLAFKRGSDTRIYVADGARGAVLAIRASNLRKQEEIPIGSSGAATSVGWPNTLVLDPTALSPGTMRPYLYVVDSNQGKIQIVDITTDTVLNRYIPGGNTPRSIAITPDGRKLFISNEQPIPTGSITVVEIGDAANGARIVDEIHTVACPQGLAMDRNGTTLYIASQCGGGDDPVFALDTRTHRIVSAIRGLAVGVSVALDPDDETLYAARGNYRCAKPGGGFGSPFSVVDLQSRKVGPTICLDSGVNLIAVSRDGDFIFVANGALISVFDGKRLRNAKRLPKEQQDAAGEAALVHPIPLEGAVAGIGVAEDNSVYAWIPSSKRLFLYSPGTLK